MLKDEISLRRIPHFTSLNKFALRVKLFWFKMLIAQICNFIQSKIVAIDGTGFSLNQRRIMKRLKDRGRGLMEFIERN